MLFKHFFEPGLAQSSYLIGCQATGEALVIDPRRDIAEYLESARKERLRITHVSETHIHADFLSGARELATSTQATLLLSDEGGSDWQYRFPHSGLRDGSSFNVGNIRIEALHTPGHTPEHISFLITDTPTSNLPVMILTGDFVFVGDVGRPDLLEKAAGQAGTQEESARQMFASLLRFSSLPQYLQMWPGHGAGSACGKALGAVPSSTVGYQLHANWALQVTDEGRFVKMLLDGQPEPPRYFGEMKKMNREGPRILGSLPTPKRLSASEVNDAIARGITIVDTRRKKEFAAGHIPGSINIQDTSAFSTWAGWILDYHRPCVLIASDDRIASLTLSLMRIGFDTIEGYYPDIVASGLAREPVAQITVKELHDLLPNYRVVDVRGRDEFEAGHIPGAIHIHGGHLRQRLQELSTDDQIVVQCASGDRSSIAASILLANGFPNVRNLTEGIQGWYKQHYQVEKGA
jgi:hydroxyacylglutathione hydrolase